MSDLASITNGMTRSLMIRRIYCVCCPGRDGLEVLQGELAAAKRKLFDGKKHTVRVGKAELAQSFDGKLAGKLTRHGLYWKKTVGKLALEQAFDRTDGYVVVKKDFRGVTVSRTYFDKEHFWQKSEYFEPWEHSRAAVIFKPQPTNDSIEQLVWSAERNRYQASELHPLPYHGGTAEQSVLTARFGEPTLVISAEDGDFCYCPKREAQQRLHALDDMKDGTIVLMPAWEVKDGALSTEDDPDDGSGISFTSLEEYARIEPGQPDEPPQPAAEVSAPKLSTDTVEFSLPLDELANEPVPTVEPNKQEQPAEAIVSEDDKILQAAYRDEQRAEQAAVTEPTSAASTKQELQVQPVQGIAAAYQGGYEDGKREGFGSYYYKDGTLCYAGGWKADQKDGLGVSFRNGDHALHISNWQDGTPGEYVTLFDASGNLRYSGKMQNGKKQGAGVTVNRDDGTVFVGKWENGEPTGLGSSFDADGNLLYYGGWKNGLRDGHGTEFDRNGGIVYDGEWKEGKYHNGILYQKLSAAEDDPADIFESTEL